MHSSEILREVVRDTNEATGKEYFRSLARHLSRALGVRYCFITECLDWPPSRVGTLAFCSADELVDDFEYDLLTTPCERVIAGSVCRVGDDSQTLFPDDRDLVDLAARSYAAVPLQGTDGRVLGHLAVLDVRPFEPDLPDLSLLELFAARAAAELERQRATAELEKSEARLRQVIDLVPHFIFAKDAEGRFVLANKAVADAYGTEVAELIGKTDADFSASDEEVEAFRNDDLDVLASGRIRMIPEEVVTDAQGRERRLQTTKIPFRFAHGGLPSVLGVAIDITERRRLEEQQQQLQARVLQAQKLESLGVLAGGIAHDFNNLLCTILGHTDLALLALDGGHGDRVREHLQEVDTATQRSAELANQMLAYSGKGNFVVGQVDLGQLVREMLDLLAVSINKKARLSTELAPDLPPIEADATQVRQVVMNLVINASDAIGDRPGEIRIRTGLRTLDAGELALSYPVAAPPAGPYLFLEVDDDGCGMDEETLHRLFDPFFTTKKSGRGLGLAALLGIVRGHRGTVQVGSEPGAGSTFTVLFPAGAPASPKPAPLPAEPAARGWNARGKTALLVDDEPGVRRVTSEMLDRLGFDVLVTADGLAAVELYRSRAAEIDIVLLDMMMPELDGMETLARLEALRPDVQVLLISGFSRQAIPEPGARSGIVGFLKKPFRFEELESELRSIFGAPSRILRAPDRPRPDRPRPIAPDPGESPADAKKP